MRKPRWISYSKGGVAWTSGGVRRDDEVGVYILVDGRILSARDARKLAAWLLKAADWLEGEK